MHIKGIHIVAASVDYFGKKRTLGTPQDFETALAQFVTLKDAGAKRGSFDFQYWKDDRRQKVNPRPICATISGGIDYIIEQLNAASFLEQKNIRQAVA